MDSIAYTSLVLALLSANHLQGSQLYERCKRGNGAVMLFIISLCL